MCFDEMFIVTIVACYFHVMGDTDIRTNLLLLEKPQIKKIVYTITVPKILEFYGIGGVPFS